MTGCDAEPREGKGKRWMHCTKEEQPCRDTSAVEGFEQRQRRGTVLTASSKETMIHNLCLIQPPAFASIRALGAEGCSLIRQQSREQDWERFKWGGRASERHGKKERHKAPAEDILPTFNCMSSISPRKCSCVGLKDRQSHLKDKRHGSDWNGQEASFLTYEREKRIIQFCLKVTPSGGQRCVQFTGFAYWKLVCDIIICLLIRRKVGESSFVFC